MGVRSATATENVGVDTTQTVEALTRFAELAGDGRKALLELVLPEVAAKMQACCSARMLVKTPEAFAQFMRDDQKRWAKKISEAGVKPE